MRDQGFDEFVRRQASGLLELSRVLSGSDIVAADEVHGLLVSSVLPDWDHVRRLDRPEHRVRRLLVRRHVFPPHGHPATESAAPAELLLIDGGGRTAPAEQRVPSPSSAAALRDLPPLQRAVLVLRWHQSMPDDEIADILDITPDSVRNLAAGALASVRRQPADPAQVQELLADEARRAPAASDLIARVLGDTRNRRRTAWIVPAAVAVAALVIVAAVDSEPSAPEPSGSRGFDVPAQVQDTRQIGWEGVRVRLSSSQRSTEAWDRQWVIGCENSVLASFDRGRHACSGPESAPEVEILVGPGQPSLPGSTPQMAWPAAEDRTDDSVSAFAGFSSGGVFYDVDTRQMSGAVRYCDRECTEWLDRVLLVAYLPAERIHVSVLAGTEFQALEVLGALSVA